MPSLLARLLINAAALYLAVLLLPGFHFTGSPLHLLGVAAVFGVVNAVVRPILTLLTCPVVVLTLGLFTFVINALMLLLTSWLSGRWGLGFRIDGFWPALLGGIVIGLVSLVLTIAVGGRPRTRN
ncbi:MAG TPA: phage holin family protein [Gemmatimonadales bacterium]|nr:phage holin family protein [Gemmatimonadales bacterium]